MAFLKNSSSEVIIVNDGSTDSTAAICEELAVRYPAIKLIHHPVNKGIGSALKSGYLIAAREYVCAIPGDGQFDINELKQITPFDNSRYYSFYRKRTNYNLYRRTLTWLNRIFNQHVLGIYLRDVNWVKVYRNEQLKMVNFELGSSLIESEICAKLYKCGILPVEIPSRYLHRNTGSAKGGSWKTLRMAIRDTLKLWYIILSFKATRH